MNVAIIDYNMGNLHSVRKAFERLGVNSIVSNKAKDILSADKLILPGVGHFKHGMEQLKKLNLISLLEEEIVNKKKPILGICLGMQLFTEYSFEGEVEGLGWIPAKTYRFKKEDLSSDKKIPHMGWNNVKIQKDSKLLWGVDSESMFYFVHTYYVKNNTESNILAETNYDIMFTSVLQKENIYGVQFHPEKSHDSGLKLLKNFIEIA